ncbi:putative purine permease [Escherichia coli]|uniref:Putative purine permease n=1 Tax=Escherichia coli TaxID=562 RepID=A0A376KMA0_ECOLX|nr:putative purine permease [Escherichia coli]
MSDINNAGSDLIFELEDRPPFHQALVGAITHLLAIFVPMVTPALIVGAALQLSAETTAYLVSMAMIASGIGTWLQVNRYGIVGSGLLSIQSVNFSFVTVMIALGQQHEKRRFSRRVNHVVASRRLLRWRISGCRIFIYLALFTSGYYAYRQRYCGTDDRLKPD